MANFFEKTVALVNAQTVFANKEAEASTKNRDLALIAFLQVGLEINALVVAAGGEEFTDVDDVAVGLVGFANEFGLLAYGKLDDAKQEQINDFVRQFITGANQELIEKSFGAALKFIVAAQSHSAVMDKLLATPPPEG